MASQPLYDEDLEPTPHTPVVESKRAYCRICTTLCGTVVEVTDGLVTKVRGDKQHPVTKGYTCPKGRSLDRWHEQPGAITHPMMRKDGKLVPVSWDEALDDIAARLKEIVAEHGPNSVAHFFGSGVGMDASGYRMAEAFYGNLGHPPKFSPLTIDGTAKLLVTCLMAGFPGLGPRTDYDECEMLIYVGTNPMVSHGHNTGMYNPAAPIRAAAARGEVWTIDPLFTETAKFSSRHIAPYPSKDYAILAWLVREIIDNGLVNLAQPVTGLEELRAAVDLFDLERTVALSGVSEQELTELFAAVKAKGKTVVEIGTGVTMAEGANVTTWLATAIMVLTGAMNRKGGTWFHPGFLMQFDTFDLPIMDHPLHPGAPTMPEAQGLLGEWPCASLPGEIEAGNIRAFMNFGGSVIRSFPDANLLAPALSKLGLCVSLEIVENETTALSTHVLPTKSAIERPDISMWDTLSCKVNMQYVPKIVPTVGDRRSAWWVISQLMRRMGWPVADHVPEDDRADGADDAMLAALFTPMARASFEEVYETRYIEKELEFPGKWVDTHIEKFGGWRLAPQELLDFWQTVCAQDDKELQHPRPLRFISRRQRRKLNAALSFLGSPADIILNPRDAEAYGIVHGEKVRVDTGAGTITLIANISDTIREGVASIPHGHEVANVNCLTSIKQIDPLGGQARYTGVEIAVTPA